MPEPGEIPRHERFYYLELLRRAGLIERFPPTDAIRLDGIDAAREAGVAHLAALGHRRPADRHQPRRGLRQRQALAARALRRGGAAAWPRDAPRAASSARPPNARCASRWPRHSRAPDSRRATWPGETTLREFIDLAAACRLFLTNDSGAMHVASALGVPTVAIFGATDDTTTGPTGPLARVVREHAECSPCLLRECPIDHRCMTRVTSDTVYSAASLLLATAPQWTHETKS